tara:strand:- start:670 stop:969 length:300 start_codon:yes stop_codon:yes gene_type:complete
VFLDQVLAVGLLVVEQEHNLTKILIQATQHMDKRVVVELPRHHQQELDHLTHGLVVVLVEISQIHPLIRNFLMEHMELVVEVVPLVSLILLLEMVVVVL